MRLLNFISALAGITTVLQGAGVWAYPSTNSAGLVAGEEDHHQLQSRAPPVVGSTVIPLRSVKVEPNNVLAWTGNQPAGGMSSQTKPIISDEAMQATAYATWKQVERSLGDTALVSVIHVPGCGWAAASVWYGSSDSFAGYTCNAPIFWNSVPGEDQGLIFTLSGKNQWHAEAVATAQAEIEFGHLFEQGSFPDNTKIATYGKSRINNKWETGLKPACSTGHSQVNVPCEDWLARLGITIVGGAR